MPKDTWYIPLYEVRNIWKRYYILHKNPYIYREGVKIGLGMMNNIRRKISSKVGKEEKQKRLVGRMAQRVLIEVLFFNFVVS